MPLSNEAISKLLGSLYDAAVDPNQWDPFLQQLAENTRATSAALVMHDFEQSLYTISRSWHVDPESARLYENHYHSLDVWAQKGLSKPTGYVCGSESLCPLREMKTTEIYNDFMVRFKVEHGMFGVLENSKSRWASLSLYRDAARSEFEASHSTLLKFLRCAFATRFQAACSTFRSEGSVRRI